MTRPLGLALSAALLLAVSCGGSGALPLASPTPLLFQRASGELVLQLSDMPAGFLSTTDSPVTVDDLAGQLPDPAAAKTFFTQHGITTSYLRRFVSNPTAQSSGRAVVSSVTLFKDATGAGDALAYFGTGIVGAGADEISLGGLIGNESRGFQISYQLSDPTAGMIDVTLISVVFRFANAVNWLVVQAATGSIDPSVAIDLSRKQLQHQRDGAGKL